MSGKCISTHELCDGIANCDDASDETVTACKESFCPSFAFRCSYGACVGGDAKCNGVKDCYDGSDEVDCQPVDFSILPTSVNKCGLVN